MNPRTQHTHTPLTRRLALGTGALAAAAAMFGGLAPAAQAAPDTAPEAVAAGPSFQVPFPCGESWTAATWKGHNPAKSVDFQHSPAEGWKVFASAKGTVSKVRDLGNTSYGKYIEIDHGNGWKTLYAHLKSFEVSEGDTVDAKTFIGRVGNTGGSQGAHLHYEQKHNGAVQESNFASGKPIYPYGKKSLERTDQCPSDPGQQ